MCRNMLQVSWWLAQNKVERSDVMRDRIVIANNFDFNMVIESDSVTGEMSWKSMTTLCNLDIPICFSEISNMYRLNIVLKNCNLMFL